MNVENRQSNYFSCWLEHHHPWWLCYQLLSVEEQGCQQSVIERHGRRLGGKGWWSEISWKSTVVGGCGRQLGGGWLSKGLGGSWKLLLVRWHGRWLGGEGWLQERRRKAVVRLVRGGRYLQSARRIKAALRWHLQSKARQDFSSGFTDIVVKIGIRIEINF